LPFASCHSSFPSYDISKIVFDGFKGTRPCPIVRAAYLRAMPLSMTKIAYRSGSLDNLRNWVERGPEALMTTRYLPKRHEEMIGGSLYWIIEHAIVARCEILGFEQREDRRWTIRLAPRLILVHPRAKRAHQGWRYLEEKDAPEDLPEGMLAGEVLPGRLVRELSKLGLA